MKILDSPLGRCGSTSAEDIQIRTEKFLTSHSTIAKAYKCGIVNQRLLPRLCGAAVQGKSLS